MGRGSRPTAASTATTGKAALFIPLVIAARSSSISASSASGNPLSAADSPAGPAPIKHSQKIPLLAGEAGQGALGAGHPPAGLAFSADGSAPVRQRQKMNNIRNADMEIVSTDLIYA